MSTARSLRVSEIFESIQGEGASAGMPCVFVRLATCNLRCSYCDTKYTWDFEAYRYEDEVQHRDVEDVAREVLAMRPLRVVVTGGEPLLQQPAVERLLALLGDGVAVEVETNGTLAPSQELARRVSQWNVSPKLTNSGETEKRRLSTSALTALLETGRAWLKVVVANEPDAAEAEALIAAIEWPRERALFMPLGASRTELRERQPLVRLLAKARGVGVSPRLHVEQWDGRRGV